MSLPSKYMFSKLAMLEANYDGRPKIDEDYDPLLEKLIAVHVEPRPDLAPELLKARAKKRK